MPSEFVTPEEWERLTEERGSVYFGSAPARRPKRQEVFLCPAMLRGAEQPEIRRLSMRPLRQDLGGPTRYRRSR